MIGISSLDLTALPLARFTVPSGARNGGRGLAERLLQVLDLHVLRRADEHRLGQLDIDRRPSWRRTGRGRRGLRGRSRGAGAGAGGFGACRAVAAAGFTSAFGASALGRRRGGRLLRSLRRRCGLGFLAQELPRHTANASAARRTILVMESSLLFICTNLFSRNLISFTLPRLFRPAKQAPVPSGRKAASYRPSRPLSSCAARPFCYTPSCT